MFIVGTCTCSSPANTRRVEGQLGSINMHCSCQILRLISSYVIMRVHIHVNHVHTHAHARMNMHACTHKNKLNVWLLHLMPIQPTYIQTGVVGELCLAQHEILFLPLCSQSTCTLLVDVTLLHGNGTTRTK